MLDEAAHSEPTEEEKSRKHILNVIYTVKIKEIKKVAKAYYSKAF